MLYITLIWIGIAIIGTFVSRLISKAKRYDQADHFLSWLFLPLWFPVMFLWLIILTIVGGSLDGFWKTVRKSLFPCLVLISLAGWANPGPDTLRLKKDTVYILPCTWHCSCDTTIYAGWLVKAGDKYFYKQGYRKEYHGHWTQYNLPVKENKCRRQKISR